MRGVILPRLFGSSGFTIIVPRVRGCRPGRFGYLHERIAGYLAERGCPELLEVNRGYCVRERARGDVDFAAARDGVLLVAEVKTRLIAKYFGRSYLTDLLLYHLAEPGAARSAWDRLERIGAVHRPPCEGTSSRDYDNPASIAELVRSVVGICLEAPLACNEARVLIASVITACYARPFSSVLLEAVRSSSRYLEKCLGRRVEPALIIIHPGPEALQGGSLTRVTVECLGEGCTHLEGVEEIREPTTGCEEYCKPCRDCKYLRTCRRACSPGFAHLAA